MNRQHKKPKHASSALQRIMAWSIAKPKGGHELLCWFDQPLSMTTLCPNHNQANLDPWMKEIDQRSGPKEGTVHRFSQFICFCVNFDVHEMLKRFHLWAWLGGFLRELNQSMSATASVPCFSPRSIDVCERCTLFRISISFVPSFSTRWMMKCGIGACKCVVSCVKDVAMIRFSQVFVSGLCFCFLFEVFRFVSLFKKC